MKKYFLIKENKIAFISQKADKKLWDKHWSKSLLKKIPDSYTTDRLFVPIVIKYLPKNSKIIEGGCGNGHVVFALKKRGYDPLGIDYAPDTIKTIKKMYPHLKFETGDVRKLKQQSNSFDGYISGGLIEHYVDGYQTLIKEMKRVLKPGGYIFITFPYISPLRRLKIKLNMYKKKNRLNKYDIKNFYQYALTEKQVIFDFEKHGMKLIEKQKKDGIKGLKDEISLLSPILQIIYSGKYMYPLKILLSNFLNPFSSHIILLVFRNEH